jgi:hypothetical protein
MYLKICSHTFFIEFLSYKFFYINTQSLTSNFVFRKNNLLLLHLNQKSGRPRILLI